MPAGIAAGQSGIESFLQNGVYDESPKPKMYMFYVHIGIIPVEAAQPTHR
jgi:hypothetical protein